MTAAPSAVGQPTTRALTSTGAAGTFAAGGSDANATIATFDATTQHNIPKAFNDYRNKAGLLTIGLAIAEPFWANGVLVAGQPKDVLVQAFERRVLTYTPSNPDAFKVEFGNIGMHYYTWRYVTNAGGGTGTTTTTTPPTAAPVLTHPTVTNITATKATISYTTNVPACGTAEVRVKGDTSFATNIDTITCTPSTNVTVTLTSLNPNTQYEVRGAAKVGSGPVGYSDIAAFTTLTAQATAESYEGAWVNDATPATGQFSQFIISTTGNSVTVHIYDKGTPTDTDIGMQTVTFTGDPLTFALNGHNYTLGFTDDTRTHLSVAVAIAATGVSEGNYTFHRRILIGPIVGLPRSPSSNPDAAIRAYEGPHDHVRGGLRMHSARIVMLLGKSRYSRWRSSPCYSAPVMPASPCVGGTTAICRSSSWRCETVEGAPSIRSWNDWFFGKAITSRIFSSCA